MNNQNRTTLSRQSTPRKKINSNSLASLLQELKTEKKVSENLSSRISSLENLSCSSKFVTRSVTPLSSKLLNHKPALNLNQVSNSSVIHPKYPIPRSSQKSPQPNPPASFYRISPSPEPSISCSEKNIDSLRLELQQRREMIIGLKETVSRKQLEHKYWALVSEIEEMSSRVLSIKKYNKEIRSEIRNLNSGYGREG